MDTIDGLRSESAAARPDGMGLQTIGFLLLHGFDFGAYWAAVEPLLVANTIAGRDLYRWVRLSVDGRAVNAADGQAQEIDAGLEDAPPFDGLVVCIGPDAPAAEQASRWLQAFASRNLSPAAVCGGSSAQGLSGVASETTLDLIDRQQGHALAVAVDDWRLRLQTVEDTARQRTSLFDRFGVREEPLLRAIAFIVARAADRPTSASIARAARAPLKKLQALFAANLGLGLQDLVLEIRLRRAQWLLQMTSMPIEKVAATCGFQRLVALNRAYRRRFAHSPKWARGRA